MSTALDRLIEEFKNAVRILVQVGYSRDRLIAIIDKAFEADKDQRLRAP